MHTGPMSESQGDFKEGYKPSGSKCPRCGAPMQYRTWESSCGGYEDEKHECTKCDYVRWVEGPDS